MPGASALSPGQLVLGRYRIVKPLARGGMGAVHLARLEGAAGFARPVVIKQVLPSRADDERAVKMFVREARVLSQLTHSGIVDILDFGLEGAVYLMVLEYVSGYSLHDWGRYRTSLSLPFPITVALHIALEVLDALHYAHSLARTDGEPLCIVHRDISPSNVLISTEGHVRLVDFGIARIESAGQDQSKTHGFKGKFAYAAPELLTGGEPSPGSDSYSCGVVLYSLLAGFNPFQGSNTKHTIDNVLHLEPRPIDELSPDMPRVIVRALARALHKHPGARFRSATEFADELRRGLAKTSAELQQEIKRLAREDFGEDMAHALELASLKDLDAAWRLTTTDDEAPSIGPSIGPTVTLAGSPPALPDRSSSLSRWAWLAAAAVVLGVGLVVAVSWPGTPTRTFEVVGEDAVQAPRAVVAAPSRPEWDEQLSADLSSAFHRQSGLLEPCFVHELPGNHWQLTLNFSVDPRGVPIGVRLEPDSAAATDFGRCIEFASRNVRFAPQARPLSFAIPLALRQR